MQCNVIGLPTFWYVKQEWNMSFTGPFFLEMRLGGDFERIQIFS